MRSFGAVFFLISSVVVFAECGGINGDVEVFNKNYNRKFHSSRDSVVQVFGPNADNFQHPEPSWKASAILTSDNPENTMSGEITFKQWDLNAPVLVKFNVSGLPAGKHSVHIHSFGDVSDGCKSTGPHFRPAIVGNIETKDGEDLEKTYEILGLNLFGFTGILGRSIVIHEKAAGENFEISWRFLFKLFFSNFPDYLRYPDLFGPPSFYDLNSISFQTEEDSVGGRLACGVITITNNI